MANPYRVLSISQSGVSIVRSVVPMKPAVLPSKLAKFALGLRLRVSFQYKNRWYKVSPFSRHKHAFSQALAPIKEALGFCCPYKRLKESLEAYFYMHWITSSSPPQSKFNEPSSSAREKPVRLEAPNFGACCASIWPRNLPKRSSKAICSIDKSCA